MQQDSKNKAQQAAGWGYDRIYLLGIQTFRYAKRIFSRISRLLGKAMGFLLFYLRVGWLAADRFVLRSTRAMTDEIAYLRKEIRSAWGNVRRAGKSGVRMACSVLWHYIKKAFVRHPRLWRTALYTALPLVGCVAVFTTVAYWTNSTYALQISYQNQSIGYVQSESVYLQARQQAQARLKGTAEEQAEQVVPTYEIKRVGMNRLVDAQTICDRLITQSALNVTNACGIYIDGSFLCAVKNETDAISVFDQLLQPYREQNPDAIAEFVEDVKYVQGFYPDTPDTMWDASRLLQTLHSTKADAVHYTVVAGDTVSGIAQKFGKFSSELYAMNPGLTETIHIDQQILIATQVNFVRVKLVKTEQRIEEIPYQTFETKNDKMYKGTKNTKVKGKNGQVRVTELVSYVDGTRIGAQEVGRQLLSEPVNAEVEVGTKSTSSALPGSGGYQVTTTSGRFIWPCVGLSQLSSPYGYRWGRLHGGVDISGSNATGKLILAAESGTVVSAGWNGAFGKCVIINHGGGVETLYAHCSSIGVSAGQRVNQGDAIGRVGSTGQVTGPHLHFEVHINGSRVNPAPYLGR